MLSVTSDVSNNVSLQAPFVGSGWPHVRHCLALALSLFVSATGCKNSSLTDNGRVHNGTADNVSQGADSCIAEVSSGDSRICIRRHNGQIACVGRGFKQLGTLSGRYLDLDGDCGVSADDGTVACWRGKAPYEPRVKPELGANSIAVADSPRQRCAQRQDGKVYCQRDVSYEVAASSGVFAQDARQIVAGVNVTCSLGASGSVSCWGDNVDGELGRLSLRDGIVTQWQPAEVVQGLPPDIVKVARGFRHFCALSQTGEVWCWGTLFDERFNTMAEQPCDGIRCAKFIHTTPQRVALPEAMTDLAGAWAMCAISSSKQVWCWGWNAHGQVRQPVRKRSPRVSEDTAPQAVFEAQPMRWEQLGNDNLKLFGGIANFCVQKQDESLWCWGSNSYLQLDPTPGVGPFKAKPPVAPTALKRLCP